MPTAMSKFLHLGMPLQDIILKPTWRPACAIARAREIGTLRPGAHADVFVFSIENGEFPLEDTHLKVMTARRRIRPQRIMRGGIWQTAGSAEPLRPLRECDHEVFGNMRDPS